jgi:hypothetical protein
MAKTSRKTRKQRKQRQQRLKGGNFGTEWSGICHVGTESADGTINAFIRTHGRYNKTAGICQFYSTNGITEELTSPIYEIRYNLIVHGPTDSYCVWGNNAEFAFLANNYGENPNMFRMQWLNFQGQ